MPLERRQAALPSLTVWYTQGLALKPNGNKHQNPTLSWVTPLVVSPTKDWSGSRSTTSDSTPLLIHAQPVPRVDCFSIRFAKARYFLRPYRGRPRYCATGCFLHTYLVV